MRRLLTTSPGRHMAMSGIEMATYFPGRQERKISRVKGSRINVDQWEAIVLSLKRMGELTGGADLDLIKKRF